MAKAKHDSVKAMAEKIETLHPDKSKKNKTISLAKYNVIKAQIMDILKIAELTHTDLMKRLYQNVKDTFEGSVLWAQAGSPRFRARASGGKGKDFLITVHL